MIMYKTILNEHYYVKELILSCTGKEVQPPAKEHQGWREIYLQSGWKHWIAVELVVKPNLWSPRDVPYSTQSEVQYNWYNLLDRNKIKKKWPRLHVTYWRHSGESGGPIYHQYPPFFYSELRNFAVLSSPRKSAMGFRSPDPEDVKGKLSRRWGINIRLQQAKPGRGGSLFIQQRKVCWRLRDDTMF